jgi:hypothetical protein
VSAESKSKRPAPRVDEESRPFWEACARGELYLQKCRRCAALRYYPRALCPFCLADETEWVRSSGRGTVYTFTVTYQNQAHGFRDRVPYIMAYVELEEGLRVLSNVVDCKPQEARVGMPVEVIFEDAGPEIGVPLFRPIR